MKKVWSEHPRATGSQRRESPQLCVWYYSAVFTHLIAALVAAAACTTKQTKQLFVITDNSCEKWIVLTTPYGLANVCYLYSHGESPQIHIMTVLYSENLCVKWLHLVLHEAVTKALSIWLPRDVDKKDPGWTQGTHQQLHLLQKVLVSNGVLTHLVLAVTPRGGEEWPWRGGCCQGLSRKALELKERKKKQKSQLDEQLALCCSAGGHQAWIHNKRLNDWKSKNNIKRKSTAVKLYLKLPSNSTYMVLST